MIPTVSIIKEPLTHADLAIFGIMSIPLKIICYEDDNDV